MIRLVEPLSDEVVWKRTQNPTQRWVALLKRIDVITLIDFFGRIQVDDKGHMASVTANVVAVAGAVGHGLVIPALGTSLAYQTIQLLYDTYHKG